MQENPENTARVMELNQLQCGFCADLMTSSCTRMYTPCYDTCITRRLPGKLQTQCVRKTACEYQRVVDTLTGAGVTHCCEDMSCLTNQAFEARAVLTASGSWKLLPSCMSMTALMMIAKLIVT
ncbi:uncharacterized protein LOC125675690 isoform X2 [Ostrea edulis]|uniref:uncharacterized protein LOC125675690 isoform X2 n=1 Tax=Ostrea edulis TaxID=37623 RepID=UPI0024AE9BFF|nr:uncharacterized protein LOC125675690 isoform X2 [Ostrea edulis]